ncbi:hypothetical protein [Desulfobacula sp.]|uniref:universal stress protein n=1 Tax=Desulfobacula sp. TaxID=2593537 RepID=UPI002621231A|nr:hypothetical protein [Desulfobacula sp.]
MTVKILIPYNFTPNDEKAIEFVGRRYGKRKHVEITLFHAFTPVPEIDNRNNPIMDKVVHNTTYLHRQQDEQKNALEVARQKLINYGFDGNDIKCRYLPVKKDVADDIIRLWKTEAFDAVVLNRNPGNIINYFTRSISKRVAQQVHGGIGVHIVN